MLYTFVIIITVNKYTYSWPPRNVLYSGEFFPLICPFVWREGNPMFTCLPQAQTTGSDQSVDSADYHPSKELFPWGAALEK